VWWLWRKIGCIVRLHVCSFREDEAGSRLDLDLGMAKVVTNISDLMVVCAGTWNVGVLALERR